MVSPSGHPRCDCGAGTVVHDAHAEVVARRALCCWLTAQLHAAASAASGAGGGESAFVRGADGRFALRAGAVRSPFPSPLPVSLSLPVRCWCLSLGFLRVGTNVYLCRFHHIPPRRRSTFTSAARPAATQQSSPAPAQQPPPLLLPVPMHPQATREEQTRRRRTWLRRGPARR